MIEVLLLRYALAAADSGSFSRAADRFRIKQSTLSKRVRYLEERLGVALFTRSTQGVAPTAGGQQFLARARLIVGELDLLSADSAAFAKGDTGTLRIGFHASSLGAELRSALNDYRRDHPGITIEPSEGDRPALVDALGHDRLDAAIIAGEADLPGCRALSLWSEPLMLGVADGRALLERDRVYWTDLIGMRFVVTAADPGKLIAAIIASRLTGPGHVPEISTHAVGRENLRGLAPPDLITVTSGAMPAETGMAYRQVCDAFGPTRLGQTLVWRATNENPALAHFIAHMERRYGRAS